MQYWLIKQEPTSYPFATFLREGSTSWSGVHHPTAQRNLRAMRVGDRAIYYHTGAVRSAVGTARVTSTPRPDPDDTRGAWTVDISADRALDRPVPLSALRDDPLFRGTTLVREPRLSVVSLTRPQFDGILRRARADP